MKLFKALGIVLLLFVLGVAAVEKAQRPTDPHAMLESYLEEILQKIQKKDGSEVTKDVSTLIFEMYQKYNTLIEKYGENLVLSRPLSVVCSTIGGARGTWEGKALHDTISGYFSGKVKSDRPFHLATVARFTALRLRVKTVKQGMSTTGLEYWSTDRILVELGAQFSEIPQIFPDLMDYYPKLQEQIDLVKSADNATRESAIQSMFDMLNEILSVDLSYFAHKLHHAMKTDPDCKMTALGLVRDWLHAVSLINSEKYPFAKGAIKQQNPLKASAKELETLYSDTSAPRATKYDGDLKLMNAEDHFRTKLNSKVLLIQRILKDTKGAFTPNTLLSIRELVNGILADFEDACGKGKAKLVLTRPEQTFLKALKNLSLTWRITYGEYLALLGAHIQTYLKDQKSIPLLSDPTFIDGVWTTYERINELIFSVEAQETTPLTVENVKAHLGATYTRLLKNYDGFRTDPVFKDFGLEKSSELDGKIKKDVLVDALRLFAANMEDGLNVVLSKYRISLRNFHATPGSIDQIQDVLECSKVILGRLGKLGPVSETLEDLLRREGVQQKDAIQAPLKQIIAGLVFNHK